MSITFFFFFLEIIFTIIAQDWTQYLFFRSLFVSWCGWWGVLISYFLPKIKNKKNEKL
jgi:hypothetical protein